jgi:chloramphenicol 3-O phosphotransferase
MKQITPGKIIILNGPSSAGKSTLALELRHQLEIPFLRFSFDLFIDNDVLPMDQIKSGTFSWKDMRPAVFEGVRRCVPVLAAAGNNLIFDHIIESQEEMDYLVQLLADFDVFFVGLHCSLEELERRELARGDRRQGEARTDLETVHTFGHYDFELNSENPPEENAAHLIEAWHKRIRPNAFDRMIALL